MKQILLIFNLLMVFFSLNAQEYSAPKPFVFGTLQIENSSENASVAWIYPNDRILETGRYEKMEIGLKLPGSVQHHMDAFFRQDSRIDQINPFNRHDLNIQMKIYHNDKVVRTVDGFYYEEFKRDLNHNIWLKDTTSFPIRLRFSPKEIGEYHAEISIETPELDLFPKSTYSFSFKVIESDKLGPIEQGEHAKNYRYEKSKESFVGVGQEIPWAIWNRWDEIDVSANPDRFMQLYQSVDALDKAGGNYTRFVATPWSLQFEWEALGNYQPKLPQAWEFDRINEDCEAREIYFLYCALLHSPLESRSDEEAKFNMPGVRWETFCYNDNDQTTARIASEPKIGITKPVEYYSNEIAFDHQQNYFRYLIARWGYSSAIAGWQIMSEADQTCDYRDVTLEDGTVIDNSYDREQVNLWAGKMVKYLEDDLGDEKMKSIAFITGKNYSSFLWDPEIYKYEEMDFLGLHDYVFETEESGRFIRNRNLITRHETVTNLNVGIEYGGIVHPQFQEKMFIYDEFGHTISIPKVWPDDADQDPTVYMNSCMDFNFKQDLWFTFASGCGVAGLDWWNPEEPKRQKQWKRYFPGLVSFASSIDFENVNYSEVKDKRGIYYISQRWPFERDDIERSNSKDYKKWDLLEGYTLIDSTQSQGFGWMNNRSFHWGNLVDSLPCLDLIVNGKEPFSRPYMYLPQDDDLTEKPIHINDEDAYIKVFNLKRRGKYQVDFYDTESGEIIKSVVDRANLGGTLKIYSPDLNPAVRYDVAYKFYLVDEGWK